VVTEIAIILGMILTGLTIIEKVIDIIQKLKKAQNQTPTEEKA
jgi:hypothetical protein